MSESGNSYVFAFFLESRPQDGAMLVAWGASSTFCECTCLRYLRPLCCSLHPSRLVYYMVAAPSAPAHAASLCSLHVHHTCINPKTLHMTGLLVDAAIWLGPECVSACLACVLPERLAAQDRHQPRARADRCAGQGAGGRLRQAVLCHLRGRLVRSAFGLAIPAALYLTASA